MVCKFRVTGILRRREMSDTVSADNLDSDGFITWESFYGSDNVELVRSLLEVYDVMMGRTPGADPGHFKEAKPPNLDNWHCRCSGNSNAVTRCASCHTNIESEIRSTDLTLGEICQSVPALVDLDETLGKCELVTCPAGFSTPTTPVQQRAVRGAYKNDFVCVQRPLSVSSIASSSSSSSGASSCSGTRRLPHKSLVYLASIESLEDDSDGPKTEHRGLFKCNGSQGSEDSGVHSPCSYVSSPSPPQGRPRYCDPHLSYMDRVVTEIIETEEVYVRDLQKIIEGYLKKWRSHRDFPLLDRLNDVFGNIESIYSFNSLFLRELEQCGLDPVKIAQCFVRHNTGFSVYTEYCTNYPRTVSSLTELMRQDSTARLFRERQTALQHTLPLGSYLLKPVQRILKYHLLLENIVKQYSNGYEGYKDIQDALRTMTEIAQHINDMKRRHEHEVRVQEIQSLLYGWEGEDLTTFGELCAEGAFRIHGAKAPRHVFLFDKMVLIAKEKEGGILDYKTHINCSNLMLIESVPGEPLSFHVIPFDNPKHQYTLQAKNLEQKREWTLQLKRVILENYDAVIPSHARQLVMELGQNGSHVEITADKSLPRRQHSAPEYLEKRKQFRRNSEAVVKSKFKKIRKSDAGESLQSQYKNQRNLIHNEFADMVQCSANSRRKSEPGMYSAMAKADLRETDHEKKVFVTPGNTNAEEMKTLEEVVAQILKQNVEFDKVLRRQQHSFITKKRLRSSVRTDYDITVAVEDEDKANDQTDSRRLVRQNSLMEMKVTQGNNIRRSMSFQEKEEKFISTILANVSIDGVPTSPSVWLRQQEPHLAVPSNKAGSLPRSFQINSDCDTHVPRSLRDFKVSIERPFTIASDTVPSKMLLDDRYSIREKQFNIQGDTMEDESLTEILSTPGASSDKINFHPDYKIYRSNLSTSIIKNVLTTVHNKLTKSDLGKKERKMNRVVWMLAKNCSRSLKYRHKPAKKSFSIIDDALMYKQGSPNLGERLANFSDVERRVKPTSKTASLSGVRPNSLLSMSSSNASESDGALQTCEDTDNDSFYEKSFEAIDDELNEMPSTDSEEGAEETKTVKVPPPVPSKPNMRDYRKEEEGDTSSQHSTASTVIEIQPDFPILQKGWVRHVVGKLQGEFP